MTRGRPLSAKSAAIVAGLRASRAELTYTQVAERFQLARRDALVTCDRLAAAGHLVVIRLAEPAGRRPASIYAAPSDESAPALAMLWRGVER